MKILNWKEGITTKEILDTIKNKKQIETFNEFKNYYCKYVVVKFADQEEYLIGQIYNNTAYNGNTVWYIEFWDKVRGKNNKTNKQLINEASIPYKYRTNSDRIEELYLIDSQFIQFSE